jgi:cytochrome subunit of sulfide dehydrogenase
MNTATQAFRRSGASVLSLGLCVSVLAFSLPALAQDLTLARSLAATCANCHGTHGRPRGPAMPPLAGIKADVMLQALADYRSGRRPGTVMPQIVKGYTEEQLRLVATFFEAQAAP